jgi:hypothetical protein
MTRGGSRTDRSGNQGARREVEELVVSLRGGAISEARFVAEMVSLREAFERIVGNSRWRPRAASLLQWYH